MDEFAGRVAVVTGAASGIGFGLARRFVAEGMRVALADVHRDSLERAEATLAGEGGEVIARLTDVADPGSVDGLAAAVYERWGAVHVVCNNAGVAAASRSATWEQSLETWRWVLGVNVWGIIHGLRAFVPRMLAGGEDGHIVNTASMAGLIAGEANGGPYSASKHAAVSISESLYGELKRAAAPVSVSVLCPGWVDTAIGANSARDRPGGPAGPATPGRRMADIPGVFAPSEIADRVVDAIREDRFYVLPAQPEFLEWMAMRDARIRDGRNPAVPRRSRQP